jgi:acetoin utilization deacetylase AcuC-like enzyme
VPLPALRDLWPTLRGIPPLRVWYHSEYRVPLSSLEAVQGVEPRRADFVAWYLLEQKLLRPEALRTPEKASYADLSRVHSPRYLESLHDPAVLAGIFGVDPSDVPVEAVLTTVRLACGGTVAAARAALQDRHHALNLLGGFHHAAPERGGGACAVNDIAVAIAALRQDGFAGPVWVVDLDAHPPDGLAECLRPDPLCRISSLSGSDWGPLPGVDETRLPPGCPDAEYLEALRALADRRPPAELAFVIAGGDVLANDRLGVLGLTLRGARRRDAFMARLLRGVPTVWLPAGGYRRDSWQVLAGTALVLLGQAGRRISPRTDPLSLRYAGIARTLSASQLSERRDDLLTTEDLVDLFPSAPHRPPRLLDFYTPQGIELALHQYGFLGHLERLGYSRFHVAVDATGTGDRLRVFGCDRDGHEHLLVESVVARRMVAGAEVLFVNWLTLRHPRAQFSSLRPPLPGQDVPGLGLAREATELLGRMALRLDLAGVAFRPAWYHMAYAARRSASFVDPARQGRFEALVRDLRRLPLLEATSALARGKVLMNGVPYTWEADDMVAWAHPERARQQEDLVRRERERVSFTVVH